MPLPEPLPRHLRGAALALAGLLASLACAPPEGPFSARPPAGQPGTSSPAGGSGASATSGPTPAPEPWLDTPVVQRLRPPFPGTVIEDARFLTGGELALTVRVPPDPGREVWLFDLPPAVPAPPAPAPPAGGPLPTTGNGNPPPAVAGGPRRLGPAGATPGLAVDPRGERVAYLAAGRRPPGLAGAGAGAGPAPARLDEVWVSLPGDGPAARIFALPPDASGDGLTDLSWSPDGRHLLVLGHRALPGGARRTRLLWVDAGPLPGPPVPPASRALPAPPSSPASATVSAASSITGTASTAPSPPSATTTPPSPPSPALWVPDAGGGAPGAGTPTTGARSAGAPDASAPAPPPTTAPSVARDLGTLPAAVLPGSYTWSPDGLRVALLTWAGAVTSLGVVDATPAAGLSFAYVADLDRATGVPPAGGGAPPPVAWSPDGRRLVFAAGAGERASATAPASFLRLYRPGSPPVLYVAELPPGAAPPLVVRALGQATGSAPGWRPDGHILALAPERRGAPPALRRLDATGRERQRSVLHPLPDATYGARWDASRPQAFLATAGGPASGGLPQAGQPQYWLVRFGPLARTTA